MKTAASLAVAAALTILALPALASPPAKRAAAPAKPQVVEITVTRDGFVPSTTAVQAGKPVTLVVTRKVERTCATDIVIKEYGVNQPLPLDKPVKVTLTPRKAGPIRYACAMDMIAGTLDVQD